MRSTRRLAALAVALAACGGQGRPAPSQRPPTALEKQYPVLRWAPADASWVLVAAHLGDAVAALREGAELAAAARGVAIDSVDAEVRAAIGLSPLEAEDLGSAGIRLDGSAAVFGQAGFPTAILPVASADRLRGFFDRKRPELGASESQHRGHAVFTWSRGGTAASWVALDGWLVVRVAPAAAGLEWLDEILAAPGGGSLGGDQDLAEASRRGGQALGARPSLVALVRFDRLAREVEDWKDAPADLSGCVRSVAAVAPRLVGAARTAADGFDGWAAVDLATGAAEAVRAHAGPPAVGGFYSYRAGSPLAFALAVELPWLEKMRAAARCPLLDQPIRDPVRAMTGMAGPRAVYGAIAKIDVDKLDGTGAIHLVLTDTDLVNAQLESIPGRSLFERKRTIAGREVRALSFPGAPTILYRQEGRRFSAALGEKAMAALLGRGTPPANLELAGAWLEPARIRNLEALLAIGLPRRIAHAVATWLHRYQRASGVLELDGDSLVFRAGLRRRK